MSFFTENNNKYIVAAYDEPILKNTAAELTVNKGVLRFGSAAITEPFSFVDDRQKIVSFDIELAMYVAQKLEMQIEVINLDFGGMLLALTAGKLDMIGACITITEERAKNALFSKSYYKGGIAALVRE